jgi:hypothetical protein
MKRELERAWRIAGGTAPLALELGVSPSTIRRWRRSGVPKRGTAREKLQDYKERRKARRVSRKDDLKLLKDMLAQAREIEEQRAEALDVASRLERPRSFVRKKAGPRVEGLQYHKAFNRLLTVDAIREAFVWARQPAKKFPWWQMRATLSQFSRKEDFGTGGGSSKITEVYVGGGYANAFMAQKMIPTPRARNKQTVFASMRDSLEDVEKAEGTAFLLSVDLFNYRLRTDEERRAFETQARYARARKKKQRGQRTSKRKPAGRKPSKRKPARR